MPTIRPEGPSPYPGSPNRNKKRTEKSASEERVDTTGKQAFDKKKEKRFASPADRAIS